MAIRVSKVELGGEYKYDLLVPSPPLLGRRKFNWMLISDLVLRILSSEAPESSWRSDTREIWYYKSSVLRLLLIKPSNRRLIT